MRTVKLRFKRTQQLPTLLDATCCVPLHTLLRVIGCGCVLLGVATSVCTPLPIRTQQFHSQHCWVNNVGSCCCVLLHVPLPINSGKTSLKDRECIWTSVFCCCCCFVLFSFFVCFLFYFCFVFLFLFLFFIFSAFCCILEILLLWFKSQWENQM